MARWRRLAAVVAVAMVVAGAAACNSDDSGNGSGGGDGKLKIALSNSFIGNQWRVEMANVFKSACEMPPYKDALDCSSYHSGNDVGKQTQQITNLISQGVDAIVLNAASPTGLNGIVKQACNKGIV